MPGCLVGIQLEGLGTDGVLEDGECYDIYSQWR